MKTLNLVAFAVLTVFHPLGLAAQPVLSEGHVFPGKGDKAKWDEANNLFNQGVACLSSAKSKESKVNNTAYENAIAKFKAAIAIYPYDYEYFNNLGLACKKANDLTAASEALKHSIELKPNVWENWSNLGSVYKHQGQKSEAIEAFSKALKLNPPLQSKQLLQQNINALKSQLTQDQPKAQPPAPTSTP